VCRDIVDQPVFGQQFEIGAQLCIADFRPGRCQSQMADACGKNRSQRDPAE
jgi:hypothetical protein